MIENKNGKPILQAMIQTIHDHKDYLGEVDGLIGDGDHGANMNKGFSMYGEQLPEGEISLTEGLNDLGTLLMEEIGGSMGPIYGTLFTEMAEAGKNCTQLTPQIFLAMLRSSQAGLYDIVDARVGDKTLVDTLAPAIDAFEDSLTHGASYADALKCMKQAAEDGKESTIGLEAKYGRSARLGKRSIGVQDAGATSCCLLLCAMADAMLAQLEA